MDTSQIYTITRAPLTTEHIKAQARIQKPTFFSAQRPYLKIWSITIDRLNERGQNTGLFQKIIQIGGSPRPNDFKPSEKRAEFPDGDFWPKYYRWQHWTPGALSNPQVSNPETDVLLFEDYTSLEKLFAQCWSMETGIEPNPWYISEEGWQDLRFLELNVRHVAIGYGGFRTTHHLAAEGLAQLARFVGLRRVSVYTLQHYGPYIDTVYHDENCREGKTTKVPTELPVSGLSFFEEEWVRNNFMRHWRRNWLTQYPHHFGDIPQPYFEWMSESAFNAAYSADRSTELESCQQVPVQQIGFQNCAAPEYMDPVGIPLQMQQYWDTHHQDTNH